MSFFIFRLLTFVLLGRPQDFFPILASLRMALVLTLILLALTILGYKKKTSEGIFNFKMSKKYAFFYLTMILGIPFAYFRRAAFDYVFLIYLSNMLFFYFCFIYIDSIKKLKSIIYVICFSVLFYGALSWAKGGFNDPTGRLSFGEMYDSNDLAYLLVSLFPLSLIFIINKEGLFKKILGITTFGISVIVILLTGSRGGVLSLAVVFTILLFKYGRTVKLSYKISLLAISLVMIALYSSKINTERYESIREVGSDYNVTAEDGRLAIWAKGIQLALSNPITGVGVDCFPKAIGEMRAALGEHPRWQPAHNAYVQVAAEVGLIGFFIFSSMISGTLKSLSLCIRSEITSPQAKEFKSIAMSIQIGFIGSLVSAFFLTQAYSILFTLFFALAVVMRKLLLEHSDQRQVPHKILL
jgi:O-antigen ligase